MAKKTFIQIVADNQLDKLLSVAEATQLAKKLGAGVICNQGWPEELTGKEKQFTITSENLGQVVSAVVCRPNGFSVRIPLTYKVECGKL